MAVSLALSESPRMVSRASATDTLRRPWIAGSPISATTPIATAWAAAVFQNAGGSFRAGGGAAVALAGARSSNQLARYADGTTATINADEGPAACHSSSHCNRLSALH